MSAILSADDLNDFISPGVACIKPIETIPKQNGETGHQNPYEVTTEDKVAASNPAPAQISLTDCLACSGCVTSAEAVLVSLQSHTEVLNTLDAYPPLTPPWIDQPRVNGYHNGSNEHINGTNGIRQIGKMFIASVSPQTRASLAATYGVSHAEAGNMIAQLLSGPNGLAAGGSYGNSFLWVIDTNHLREAALVLAAGEVASALSDMAAAITDDGSIDTKPKKPILTSACPGWICYAEKTHPYILPHLSRLKSPQALAGTLLKSVLSRKYGIPPSSVWHLAVMPCFDKKLEASRSELTSAVWTDGEEGIRDVDCVITARELITLAATRGIDFAMLPRTPLSPKCRTPFPDPIIDRFLFPPARRKIGSANGEASDGTSGGYLWHILQTYRAQYPGSRVQILRGRNADVVEYLLVRDAVQGPPKVLFKAARYYGFRNIQNLVRRLKPAKASKLLAARGAVRRPQPAGQTQDYAYVEVMACPGGCTNGGGQIKAGEVGQIRGGTASGGVQPIRVGPQEQREWLAKVDEAYFSAPSSPGDSEDEDRDQDSLMTNGHTVNGDGHNPYSEAMDIDDQTPQQGIDDVDGVSHRYIHSIIEHWTNITAVEKQKLVLTSYRKVESDVGKKTSDVERVAGLASSIGGGW